jgi:hypothetical protein
MACAGVCLRLSPKYAIITNLFFLSSFYVREIKTTVTRERGGMAGVGKKSGKPKPKQNKINRSSWAALPTD